MKGAQIQQVTTWLETFSHRQRIGIVITAGVVVLLLFDLFFLNSLIRQYQSVTTRGELAEQQLNLQQSLQQTLLDEQSKDPNEVIRRDQKNYQARLGELDEQLQASTVELVSPKAMTRMLESIFTANQIKIIQISNLPAQSISVDDLLTFNQTGLVEPASDTADDSDNNAAEYDQPIYRHGVKLVFEGDYFGVMRFTQQLEQLPFKVYWDHMDITTEKFPVITVILKLHSLNFEEGWLGV